MNLVLVNRRRVASETPCRQPDRTTLYRVALRRGRRDHPVSVTLLRQTLGQTAGRPVTRGRRSRDWPNHPAASRCGPKRRTTHSRRPKFSHSRRRGRNLPLCPITSQIFCENVEKTRDVRCESPVTAVTELRRACGRLSSDAEKAGAQKSGNGRVLIRRVARPVENFRRMMGAGALRKISRRGRGGAGRRSDGRWDPSAAPGARERNAKAQPLPTKAGHRETSRSARRAG
jgi:hypothetical protein